MAKPRSALAERKIIVGDLDKRPYGVKVRFQVMSGGAVGFTEHITVLLRSGAFATLSPEQTTPWEGGKKFCLTIEGFSTTANAGRAGYRLVQSILWLAVTTSVPLRLDYRHHEPYSVFERARSSGSVLNSYGETGFPADVIYKTFADAYSDLSEPDPKVMLSMEIFCSAGIEASQRSRFISVVSALEPLAAPKFLGEEITGFVEDSVKRLHSEPGIDLSLKTSLEGRFLQLRTESIRQALRRLIKESLPNDLDSMRIMEDAYDLRSQIIHNGLPNDLDVDLESAMRDISGIIRRIYASLLKQQLLVQA